jgi:hypothetical protein
MNVAAFRGVSAVCLILPWCRAADAPVQKVEIGVERKAGARVERMDPNHVFEQGDLVRFRFKPSFAGYLYVMDRSTSGKYLLLFPKEDTGLDNRIEADRSYLLPMTESGWFRVEGPAGHEILYWFVSPARLNEPRAGAFPIPKLPAEAAPLDPAITPRCDDAIFRARGECLDATAGAKPIRNRDEVPANLSGLAAAGLNDAGPRELTVTKSDKQTAVVLPPGDDAPFLYTFRLAHR